MGLFKCLNFQSFPLYLSKRKASVHFHEQMPCLKAVFLQPLCRESAVSQECDCTILRLICRAQEKCEALL